MDKEEKSSRGKGEEKPNPKLREPSQSNPSRTRARRRRSRFTPEFKLFIAFITAIAPIVVAWLGYQANLSKPTPVATITSTSIPSATSFMTSTSMVFTDTLSPTSSPSPTSTLPATASPSETMTPVPAPKLIVLLTASKSSGKAPLRVKFDARESYLTDYDGQRYVCRNGPCNYIWRIYSQGEQIGKSKTDSGGTLDYSFGKKGTYTVSVWICRGQDKIDCGGSSIQVTVS